MNTKIVKPSRIVKRASLQELSESNLAKTNGGSVLKRAFLLAALLLLPTACQQGSPAEGAEVAAGTSGLSIFAVSQGCLFSISAQPRPGTLPPVYDYVITR